MAEWDGALWSASMSGSIAYGVQYDPTHGFQVTHDPKLEKSGQPPAISASVSASPDAASGVPPP